MVDEMSALHENGTWELVSLPPDQSIVGCWVFTMKYLSDGTIGRYKARLVAIRGILRPMVLVMARPSLQLLRLG